ncbi:MAG: hypothetical protein QXJ64_10620 [Thermosphaera sp.]
MRSFRRVRINFLILVLTLCFILYVSLSNVVVSNVLMLSWIVRLLLLLYFSLGFLGLMLILLQRSRKEALLHHIVIFMLALLYVSGLFSKGIYFILFDNDEHTIIPSMRSTAAKIMLDNTGRLDVHMDPHYLYPLEYLVVYMLKTIVGIPYLTSYVVIFGIFILALNSLIISLLINIRNVGGSSIIQRLLAIGLLLHLLGTFYLGEYNTARSLFYLAIYILISSSLYGSSSSSVVLLFLLIVGTTFGSLRTSIIVSLLFILANAYYFVKSKKIVVSFITMCTIPLVHMFYYGSLYVKGYADYFAILTQSLLNAILHGFFEVKNQPLHTVVRTQYPSSYVITGFLGGLSFIVLLIVSYISVLVTLIREFIYIDKSKYEHVDKLNSSGLEKSYHGIEFYKVAFITATLLFGAILGLAYLLNVLGYFVIDFESMTDLLLPMPMALILASKNLLFFNQDNQKLKTSLIKATNPMLATALIILLAFSFFGLKLRYPIICMSEARLMPDNSLLGVQHVSKAFEFVVTRSFAWLKVELSSDFSMLYLTLPLRSLGKNPIIAPLSTPSFETVGGIYNSIYNSGLVYILSSTEDNIIILDKIRLLPY